MTADELTNEQLASLGKTISRAARSVAYMWPNIITSEDLQQDLWIEILESPATLKTVIHATENHRFLYLKRMGNRAAGKQRADLEHFSGNFAYSVNDVKKLLSNGALDGLVDEFDSAIVDLNIAIGSLTETTPQYTDAIYSRYRDGEIPSDNAAGIVLSRGLTALTDGMNRSNKRRHAEHSNGPGTRQVLSNAAAYVKTVQQYSGGFEGYMEGGLSSL